MLSQFAVAFPVLLLFQSDIFGAFEFEPLNLLGLIGALDFEAANFLGLINASVDIRSKVCYDVVLDSHLAMESACHRQSLFLKLGELSILAIKLGIGICLVSGCLGTPVGNCLT